MILKVAWRNIWRNKLRSSIVILAIAIGLWAGVFASGFVMGMMNQRVDNIIASEISHVQFHHPDFRDELEIKYTLDSSEVILNELSKTSNVIASSHRLICRPSLMSPRFGQEIKLTGIDPEKESKVTNIHSFLKEGTYLEKKRGKIPILISRKTADKFKVKLKTKMNLQVLNVHGEIETAGLVVGGIYESDNPMFDQGNVFIRLEDLQNTLKLNDQVHEIAVLLDQHEQAEPIAEEFQKRYSSLEVLSWKDLSVGMRYMIEAMDLYTLIIVGIIMVALLFSIINTMLMAVLERVRELGMLMAVGMSKGRVFLMVMLETVMLTLIGGVIGLIIAKASISYFGSYGIDLGSNAAYGDMGFSNLIYPVLGLKAYIQVTIMVFIMAILGAIYPARKALKLNPVEAIRKI